MLDTVSRRLSVNKPSFFRTFQVALASIALILPLSAGAQAAQVSHSPKGPAGSAAKVQIGAGFRYTISGKQITIVGCAVTTETGQVCPRSLIIPKQIGSGLVVAIGDGAFEYGSSSSVEIPDSVTSIGSQAFYRGALQSISLGKSVKKIGSYAFALNSLKDVSIPASVKTIDQGAFLGNFLKDITLPSGISKIGNLAFALNRLVSATFLGDAPAAANAVFNWSVRENGRGTTEVRTSAIYALKNAKGWGNTWSGVPVQKIANTDFLSYTTTSKKVTITGCKSPCPAVLIIPNKIAGNPVTSIANRAFKDAGLTYVAVPETVSKVGDSAFSGDDLAAVYLVGDAPALGIDAFASISESTKIRIAWDSDNWGEIWSGKLLDVDAGLFLTTEDEQGNLTLTGCKIHCDSNLVFPSSIGGKTVTRIGEFTHNGIPSFDSAGLLAVKIPNSVTDIGYECFMDNHLTKVEVPSSVQSIDERAFAYNEITSVKLPSQKITFRYGVFSFNKLAQIDFPSSWTEIPDGFLASNELKKINLPANLKMIGENSFRLNKLTSVTIPDSVTEIRDEAFAVNTITKLPKLPSGLTVFKNWFASNPIKSVVIPENFTVIGNNAFYDMGFTSITIPDSVTEIGIGAFQNNMLKTVTIPSSVTSIASLAFNANRLTSVKFEGNAPLVHLMTKAECGCDNLPTVANIFARNRPLKEITVNSGRTGWGATWAEVAVKVVP